LSRMQVYSLPTHLSKSKVQATIYVRNIVGITFISKTARYFKKIFFFLPNHYHVDTLA
jgi:hypothetical protein